LGEAVGSAIPRYLASCDPPRTRWQQRHPHDARAPLSTKNLRRVYKAAVEAAGADLAHLDLRGPHDLRHIFATWLEDAGIPSRVIDELMGHAGGRRDH
jgi:integrase